jgi:ATP-dependent DNA helicase RecQ
MLTGRLEDLPESLAGLTTTGILSDRSAKSVEAWIEAAVGADLLRASDDAYRTLALTRLGREVMSGRATAVELTLPDVPRPRPRTARRKKGAAAPASGSPADEALVERLRAWRGEEAARRGVPAYVVLHDSTLTAIAAARPRSLDALSEIPGIGPSKRETYGSAILAITE